MVNEQTVAFAMIDFENLLNDLETDGIINSKEYEEFTSMKNIILNRCGFKGGK